MSAGRSLRVRLMLAGDALRSEILHAIVESDPQIAERVAELLDARDGLDCSAVLLAGETCAHDGGPFPTVPEPARPAAVYRARAGVDELCDCPRDGGMVRHQRGQCTDPVVAVLGWYADAPGAVGGSGGH